MDVTFDLSEIEQFGKHVNSVIEGLPAEMEMAMTKSVLIAQANIAALTPVNLGLLRGSELTTTKGEGVKFTGMVYTDLIYGWPIEAGRKAGKMPPIEPLQMWVIRKMGIVSPIYAYYIALQIARKMKASGTKGVFMFQRGLKQATPPIIQIWTNLRDQIVLRIRE